MKKLLKIFLTIISLLLFIQLLFYCYLYVALSLRTEYPGLFYEGNRTVPEEDIVYLEKLTIRDLRQDRVWEEDNELWKYYILKKLPFQSKKMIKEILSNYCKDFYDSHNAYDQIIFVFYKEGGRMPWFWNNDDFFDLEYNSGLILGSCFVDKKGCRFREGDAW